MARLSNYKIVRVYGHPDHNRKYHITDKGHIIRTTGPRMGGAKFISIGPTSSVRRVMDDKFKESLAKYGFVEEPNGTV